MWSCDDRQIPIRGKCIRVCILACSSQNIGSWCVCDYTHIYVEKEDLSGFVERYTRGSTVNPEITNFINVFRNELTEIGNSEEYFSYINVRTRTHLRRARDVREFILCRKLTLTSGAI